MEIAIIDFHSSNMKSIFNFFKRNFKGNINIFDNPSINLESTDLIVIPGVGHFGHASNYIFSSGLNESINNFYLNNKPIIGICLGAQLLTRSSEEAPGSKGLGLLDADCKSLSNHPTYKENIPRIGWSGIKTNEKEAFYFVHSYYIHVNDNNLKTTLAVDNVTAMVESNNILAMQFHPEKSDKSGELITKSFIDKYV